MRFNCAAVTFFALLGLMVLSSTSSFAQDAKKSVAAAPTIERTPPPFSFGLEFTRTRNLYDYQDGSLSESNDFEFSPSYAWSKGRTTLFISYSQDLRATDANNASDINDIVISNSLKPWELPKIKLSPSFNVTIPQSKISREVKNLEGGISVGLGASIRKELLISGLSLSASISAARTFHRYTTDLMGQVNNQYSSSQTLSAGYGIGSFSMYASLSHINVWNYNGALKESYAHNEGVSMDFADHFGFSLGHTNAGSVFAANGYSSNYKLIDDNNSLVYAKVSMQY